MNSYPPELLVQLAPVMFVAGLDLPQSSEPTLPKAKPDEFASLIARLREALQNQRKAAIWQSEKAKTFHVVLVEKEVRFPPRKLVPPEDPGYSASHSPLSPLTPSSPLHPDGLIAPIWVRKHTTLVPSVFVLFLRIYEHPAASGRSPLEGIDSTREKEKEQEERRRDTELAAEVALRKRSTNEHGIKLTVVLMSSRKMLDDPTLDSRLTFIRRQSGLDSRAALFVLSPVSTSELSEFVKSLQQALYDPALEHYTNHSKRVRRKRNRHSQSTPYPGSLPGAPHISRPLRPEGWTVRYEYKMACFAEFRGEDEVALKHYQDAYSTLTFMFGSTAILPPRTKRWAEAKVLADTVNIKITKLYLYNNEHALAFSNHNTHVQVFSDFSRGWGIGEDTFEYWSWIARQHRVLAELLEQGTQSTLLIPVHRPVNPTTPAQRVGSVAIGAEAEALRSLGLSPSHALQHPGYYYYLAARCTEVRRERFLAALQLGQQPEMPVVPSPGFTNEKKVDHLTIILELYTKAYELFKKYTVINPQNPVQGRLTLWIACRIANTYYDSGKFDMAMRFFERIAKSYRREQWGTLLRPLLSTWQACAHQLGDNELQAKLLVETLGYDVETYPTHSLQQDLLNILKNTSPSSSSPIVIDLFEAQPIFNSNTIFWASEVNVGRPAPFQISMTAPLHVAIDSLPFSSLSIYLSHRDEPIVVEHRDSETSSFQFIELGHVSLTEPLQEVFANLRWEQGGSIVFSGTASSDEPSVLKVSKLVLTVAEGPWVVELQCNSCSSRGGLSSVPQWVSSINPPRYFPITREESSSTAIKYRQHNLSISLDHQSPAYLQEEHPIILSVTNADDREFIVVVDVLLPPTDVDGITNTIRFGNEESTHYIKGVPFGKIAPGETISKTLYLINTGAPGERILDISVQSGSTSSATLPDEIDDIQDVTETLRTLTILVVDPFEVIHTINYGQDLTEWPGLADLSTFDGNGTWDCQRAGQAVVKTSVKIVGPSSLVIAGVNMERLPHNVARIVDCSADDDPEESGMDFYPGDEQSHLCRVVFSDIEDSIETTVDGVGRYRIDWRRLLDNGDCGQLSSTIIDLPLMEPPAAGLLGLLSLPPAARLHVPLTLVLTVRNYRTIRSANITVQLEAEPTDSFVVAGLRSGRLPLLLPRTEETLFWRLIPIECGYVKIPRVKVIDYRQPFTGGSTDMPPEVKGELVNVIDVWLDQQHQDISGALERGTILVLP